MEERGDGMNKELGVLLLELPEPCAEYTVLSNFRNKFFAQSYVFSEDFDEHVFKCTRKEAEQFPQFKWVSLEELE